MFADKDKEKLHLSFAFVWFDGADSQFVQTFSAPKRCSVLPVADVVVVVVVVG